METDDLDKKILNYLKEDARVSLTKVAKELGVPEPTIYFRVNRLQKEGVIRRFTVITGEEASGAIRAAYVHTRNYLLSDMTERIVNRVGEALAAEPAVVFVARVDRAKLFAAWRGPLDPRSLEGVARVEEVPAQAFKG